MQQHSRDAERSILSLSDICLTLVDMSKQLPCLDTLNITDPQSSKCNLPSAGFRFARNFGLDDVLNAIPGGLATFRLICRQTRDLSLKWKLAITVTPADLKEPEEDEARPPTPSPTCYSLALHLSSTPVDGRISVADLVMHPFSKQLCTTGQLVTSLQLTAEVPLDARDWTAAFQQLVRRLPNLRLLHLGQLNAPFRDFSPGVLHLVLLTLAELAHLRALQLPSCCSRLEAGGLENFVNLRRLELGPAGQGRLRPSNFLLWRTRSLQMLTHLSYLDITTGASIQLRPGQDTEQQPIIEGTLLCSLIANLPPNIRQLYCKVAASSRDTDHPSLVVLLGVHCREDRSVAALRVSGTPKYTPTLKALAAIVSALNALWCSMPRNLGLLRIHDVEEGAYDHQHMTARDLEPLEALVARSDKVEVNTLHVPRLEQLTNQEMLMTWQVLGEPQNVRGC